MSESPGPNFDPTGRSFVKAPTCDVTVEEYDAVSVRLRVHTPAASRWVARNIPEDDAYGDPIYATSIVAPLLAHMRRDGLVVR